MQRAFSQRRGVTQKWVVGGVGMMLSSQKKKEKDKNKEDSKLIGRQRRPGCLTHKHAA
jgi:hypothetical protein